VGCFIGLALLKFANPVVLDHKVQPPGSLLEAVVWSWPLAWAFPALSLVAVAGVFVFWFEPRVRCATPSLPRPWWWLGFCCLPALWFAWQCLSAAFSANGAVTRPVLWHFLAGCVFFYVGLLGLSKPGAMSLWPPIVAALIVVVWVGFDQHFGGLEATRQYIYRQPDWEKQSPEFLRKIASNRIYSTLFYPNTLAGALLLFLPPVLAALVSCRNRLTLQATSDIAQAGRFHRFIVLLAALLTLGSIACLYWSGSKAGWLIALFICALGLLCSEIPKRTKVAVALFCFILGISGFLVAHFSYFQRGAKSVEARFGYWRVAGQIAMNHPVLGSGPGTFWVLYRYMKPPDAEMARLVHNDYLQQAADSGLPGFLLYSTFMLGSVVFLRPNARSAHEAQSDSRSPLTCANFLVLEAPQVRLGLWLGIVGYSLHGLIEFNLYIPALSWSAFLFLGWLWSWVPREPIA